MREQYTFLSRFGVLAIAGTFAYHMVKGEDVRTSLETAAKCTTILIGAEISMHLLDKLIKSPELNAYLYLMATGCALGLSEWLDDLGNHLVNKPKNLPITPKQKVEMAIDNNTLRKNLITMLVEAGEPVQEVGFNGEVQHGYRVIAGLPKPQVFFPPKEVREKVEALKKNWVEKSVLPKSGEITLFM